ncbi:hypothetical protein EMCRGX_G001202 [Ephydatia muelleri]
MRITPHRVINAVAFASMSSTILTNVLFPQSFGTVGNAYGQVFIDELTKWFWVLFQTVLYFPLFGCLNAPIRWLGMVVGTIYCTLTLITEVLSFAHTSCLYNPWPQYRSAWNQHNNEETDYYKQWVKELLRYKRFALILMLIVYIVQWGMCKYIFTDKTFQTCGKKQTAKDTVITHIQLYHWWTYVFFIINTFSGLLSSFLRSLCSAVIVLLLLLRMDRNIYIKGLERFDRGYSTYVAFLYLEYVQNHPIMSAFVQILGEGKSNDTPARTSQKGPSSIDITKGNCCVSRRARNRWFVAYTLLRNPDLQCLTSNRLNEANLNKTA